MAKRNSNGDISEVEISASSKQIDRVVNLLALLLVKGENQTDKILTLAAAGFTAAEIAHLLQTTANTVSVTVYQAKKAKPKAASRRKAE